MILTVTNARDSLRTQIVDYGINMKMKCLKIYLIVHFVFIQVKLESFHLSISILDIIISLAESFLVFAFFCNQQNGGKRFSLTLGLCILG